MTNEGEDGVVERIRQSSDSLMPVLEQALEEINKQLKHIVCLFLLCSVMGVFNGWHILVSNFYDFVPPYWCRIAELEAAGWTAQQTRDITSLNNTDDSGCSMVGWNYTKFAELGYEESLQLINNSTSLPEKVQCTKFFYEEEVPYSTVVVEWDLVCENKIGKSNVQGSIATGKFIGGFITGFMADKYGRRPIFLISCIIYIANGTLAAVTSTFWVFLLARFLTGIAGCGCYESAFTILAEFVNEKRRVPLGCMFNLGYPVSYIILPGLSLLFKKWRHLQLAISLPMIIFSLHYWLLPESPRWLLVNGRYDKAWKIIKRFKKNFETPGPIGEAAKTMTEAVKKTQDALGQAVDQYIPGFSSQVDSAIQSSVPVVERALESNIESAVRGRRRSNPNSCLTGLKDIFLLFSTFELCKRITISIFNFVVAALIYYVLALNAGNFHLEQHLYTFISGWIEIPGYLAPFCIMKCMGRKCGSSLLYFIAGLCLVFITVLPKEQGTIILVIAMLGKFMDVAVFALVTVYCAELFPTKVRTAAVGVSLAMSQLGSIFAPYIVDLLGPHGWYIPSTICGVTALLACIFILMLPETKGKPLLNTVDDVKNQPDRVSPLNCCKFS